MTDREILYMILINHPIEEGKRATWINPVVLVDTYQISEEMANKVAEEYNSEALLNQIKITHPIEEGKRATWINPGVLVDTFQISNEMAYVVAMKYNHEAQLSQQKGVSR